MTCAEFYKANKNDKDMLMEVLSNEKYQLVLKLNYEIKLCFTKSNEARKF